MREGIENLMRYRSDVETNNQEVQVLRDGEFRPTKSMDVQVGDLLLVNGDESFACDLILLTSSSFEGVAYIQTSSLDGEKNLKKRTPPKGMMDLLVESCEPSHLFAYAAVTSELPNKELY